MTENERLLPQPSSGSYYSLTTNESNPSSWKRLVKVVEAAENSVKKAWARAVLFIHAREFFAEFLGTFILVVSYTEAFMIVQPFSVAFIFVICRTAYNISSSYAQ